MNNNELRKEQKLSVVAHSEVLPVAENNTEVSSVGFVPLPLLCDWIEPGTTASRLVVALLLPSEVVP